MRHFIKECISLIRDLIKMPSPQDILVGKSLFRPFLKYQQSWMNHFYPHDKISSEQDAWFYLRKYMFPLIKKHASSYHIKGIDLLNLNTEEKPNFNKFQDSFYKISNGFEIIKVTKEISPIDYFSLIKTKKFPCIEQVRPLNEIFCGNEPDFWHEAIGHIAPLCFQEVQDFYTEIANYMLSSTSKLEFKNNLALAWTITEYGFIQEKNQYKMFGAALVGSHLANMRYLNGLISIEPASRESIINSQFYAEESSSPPRDSKGNLRFFSLNSLQIQHLFPYGQS